MHIVALWIEDERGPLGWREDCEWWLDWLHADKPTDLSTFDATSLDFFNDAALLFLLNFR